MASGQIGSPADPYKWLENDNDPRVQQWSEGENTKARNHLDAIAAMPGVQARLKELSRENSEGYWYVQSTHGRLYAMRSDPTKEQPFIVELDSYQGKPKDHVVVDPNVFDPKGGSEIDWYKPSLDGQLVAVSISQGGSENGDLRVFRSSDGSELIADRIPRVNKGTASGGVAWLADGSGFYYTRYPGSERPASDSWFYQKVYFHKLGTDSANDTPSLSRELPRIAETILLSSPDGRFFVAAVENGDGGQFAIWLLRQGGRWKKLAGFSDGVGQVQFCDDGNLYLLCRKNTPYGEIRRTPLSNPSLRSATTVVRESHRAIDFFRIAGTHLYTDDQLGGYNGMRCFDLRTGGSKVVDLGAYPAVRQIVPVADGALIQTGNYLKPAAWYEYVVSSGQLNRTQLVLTPSPDLSAYQVLKETAVSKDGSRVPIFLIAKRGMRRDGNNPLLLTGYGGFADSQTPFFIGDYRVLLERGFILAVAAIRGGREFGENWHRQSQGASRQNVFDDFYAAARRLIDAGYTRSSRLALKGGSNGGLLVGAAAIQHPSLCRVIVSEVGIYDMPAHMASANGQFNVPEYGSPSDPRVLRAMLRYSPYYHVRRVKYPAMLLTTGANDPRVQPLQSRKMVAKMHAMSPESLILLRSSASAGHGVGTRLSGRLALEADGYGFILEQLGFKK